MILNTQQNNALTILNNSKSNFFLTGYAGTGKSTVLFEFMDGKRSSIPVLASTGAAAVIIGGRTAHSFFGLRKVEEDKPVEYYVQEVASRYDAERRLRSCNTIVIDEISMVSKHLFEVFEAVARYFRRKSDPWGGLRVILVGDFAQLPPVQSGQHSYAFQSPRWQASNFAKGLLTETMRTSHREFIQILKDVRAGECPTRVSDYLDSRKIGSIPDDYDGVVLFSKNDAVRPYNMRKLEELPGEEFRFDTEVWGNTNYSNQLLKNLPIDDQVVVRSGALVMIRVNDREQQYVNGTTAIFEGMEDGRMKLVCPETNKVICLDRYTWEWKGADGEPVCWASNYPISLAWAMTVHKSQGATLDKVCVNLCDMWEPGHAYVALSRAKNPDHIDVLNWDIRSIRVDPQVVAYYDTFKSDKV